MYWRTKLLNHNKLTQTSSLFSFLPSPKALIDDWYVNIVFRDFAWFARFVLIMVLVHNMFYNIISNTSNTQWLWYEWRINGFLTISQFKLLFATREQTRLKFYRHSSDGEIKKKWTFCVCARSSLDWTVKLLFILYSQILSSSYNEFILTRIINNDKSPC